MSALRIASPLLALVASLHAQSERPPEQFAIGVGLQQRGLHDEAAAAFEQFLQQHGKHALAAEAWYRLGLARIELKTGKPAVAALRQALAAGGKDFKLRPECRYRLGNLLEQGKEHGPALEQFEALASEIPADHYLRAAALYAAGEACRELQDDEKAGVAFAAAAEAATGERGNYKFPALYQLGFTQVRRQQLAEAAATFALAATAAPDDGGKGECFYLSGDALLRLHEHDAAERAFSRAVKLGGDFADDAAHGLGWVALGRDDRAAAVRAFGNLLERFPDSPLAASSRLERGRALYQDGKAAQADQELQPLLAEGVAAEVRQQARELVGLCALATGAGDVAVTSLRQALQQAAAGDRPRLSYALGEALANLGRWEEALAAYDAVPAEAPAELRGDALYGACFAAHELGRHQDSIARAKLVVALAPPHRLRSSATLALGENHFALQQYPAAEQAFAELAGDATHGAEAAWKVAWCRYLRGEHLDAAKRFATIAAKADDAHAEEALAMQALAELEGKDAEAALASADRYRARYPTG
ncbi:MAG: tetratricopeptide repeat protein, partial [Planctomycetota bacterium]